MQENKLSDSIKEDRKQSHGTAGVLRYEHQISNDSKKSKRKKDKIVVSKLAKSDRPLRAKNAEKQPKEKFKESGIRKADSDDNSSLDYRLTLNRKRKEQLAVGKFTRSISQLGH